jgi:YD repeat-containing protein
MRFDSLDRLTDAGAVMFGGDHWHRFTYDAIDNLRSWKLAGVKDLANYVYDGNYRLTSVQNSGGATVHSFAYDPQGNLSNKNSIGHDFDFGNRLREVSGQEYYRYDDLGRRVLAWRPVGGSTLSMYSQSGQVMYQHAEPKGFSSEHI